MVSRVYVVKKIAKQIGLILFVMCHGVIVTASTVDYSIDHWPRYSSDDCIAPAVAKEYVDDSISLPAITCGGFRISTAPIKLVAGKRYVASLRIKNEGIMKVSAHIFSAGKTITKEKKRLLPGDHLFAVSFIAKASYSKAASHVYFARFSLKSEKKSKLEIIGIRQINNETVDRIVPVNRLHPDRTMSIYKVDEGGYFTLRYDQLEQSTLRYTIKDSINSQIIKSARLIDTVSIELDTKRRGSFEVEVTEASKYDERIIARREYVVLGNNAKPTNCLRYGLTMEHHGRYSRSSSLVTPDDYYSLASRIGAGSARIFSLASPQALSDDGIRYDFSQLDGAIEQMRKYGLEPFVLLGSDDVLRLPKWMRYKITGIESVNLLEGARNKKRRAALLDDNAGHNLDLSVYRNYLITVMEHLKGSNVSYGVWNEPGHKFTAADIVTLAKLTASVRDKIDPDAQLVGYSSTTRLNNRMRRVLGEQPLFLRSTIGLNGLDHIDVLSMHSAHYLNYLGKDYNHSDLNTGFANKIRQFLPSDKMNKLPLWDTERGTPWRSRHDGRFDKRNNKNNDASHKTEDWLEPVRRLPAIYAEAFASGVERLYWFSFDSSSHIPLEVSSSIRAMFDADHEPMPHIAAYAAMTEMLGCAKYQDRLDDESGNRAYIFGENAIATILTYNWKRSVGALHVDMRCDDLEIRDVMGNAVTGEQMGKKCVIPVSEWMSYIMTKQPVATTALKFK